MEFIEQSEELISCVDWCDLEEEDVYLGNIRMSSDGYFRFIPQFEILGLTCSHMKQISKKLSELNKGA